VVVETETAAVDMIGVSGMDFLVVNTHLLGNAMQKLSEEFQADHPSPVWKKLRKCFDLFHIF